MARTNSYAPPQQSASGNHPHGQGTFGGLRHAVGRAGRRPVALGDEVYLWLLVLAEVGAIGYFRKMFSRYHGG